MNLITLTTDFGTRDWFVGAMKGVILGIAPRAVIVDLTHEIPPGDVRAGAFALKTGCRCFPNGTIHVAVVDPGVGSARRALAVKTERYFFVGPDNGLLSWALLGEKIQAVRQIRNQQFFLQPVSRTFHGRDVFAPVAAHLSRGVPIQELGPVRKDFLRLDWPPASSTRTGIEGEVVYLDRFGNAITNLPNELLQGTGARTAGSARPQTQKRAGSAVRAPRRGSWKFFAQGRLICSVAPCYQAVPAGQPVAVPGSSGFLEIAVNGGSAAGKLGLQPGDKMLLCER